MIKKILWFFIICCFLTLLAHGSSLQKAEQKGEKEKEWPKVGSVYKYSGVEWYVRGVDNKPFEYTATGESLGLVIEDTSGSIVLVPKKGQVVRCDPTEPMIYVDKKPDPDLSRNSYFKRTAKDKVWLLLELKRK
ncbi:MAG: hypothetical protein KAT17_03625 [Candidatus Aminicenantes bacterium]|nr:hypothetical protein [Candidatus Aminicenantes bacterium]